MSSRDEAHKVATGHRKHMTGGGPHDPRPNRKRTRGDAERAAIKEQKSNG